MKRLNRQHGPHRRGGDPNAATQVTISDVLLEENNPPLLDEVGAELLSETETVQAIGVILG